MPIAVVSCQGLDQMALRVVEAVETVEKSVDAKSFYLSACEACIEFFLELKRVAKVLNSSQKNYLILAEKIKSELND